MAAGYRKGYSAELELVHTLSKMGYMTIRSPRSGRINLASPDVIAAKAGKLIVVECKSRKNAFMVPKEQLAELKEWEQKAGAVPYVAWKISRKGWVFIHADRVAENNGNVGKKFAGAHGIKIDDI